MLIELNEFLYFYSQVGEVWLNLPSKVVIVFCLIFPHKYATMWMLDTRERVWRLLRS
jgi:hypothetical protein